jgi:antitoxin HicB
VYPGLKRLPAYFYRLNSGREPVREWLKELEPEDRKAIGEDIEDVEFSWPIGMPLGRSLDRDLWEVRSSLSRGRTARVLFCLAQGRMVLLPRYRPGPETEERRRHMKRKNVGSSFDSWLREEGVYEEVTATAIKRVLARQVEAAMKERKLSKAEMARRMHTSRAALDRLLDPEYDAVTLNTLCRAATAVGRGLRLELR